MTQVTEHLASYRQRIQSVHEAVLQDHQSGLSDEAIRQRYHDREKALAFAQGLSSADWDRFEMSNATSMCADGVLLAIQRAIHVSA